LVKIAVSFLKLMNQTSGENMKTKKSLQLIIVVAIFTLCLVTPMHVLANETGIAAYYSNVFQGRKTASGERYDKNALTAAHNRYAFGTKLRVTNLKNNKSVTVRVNDRGPHTAGRIIDLSRKAANELGFVKEGLTKVTIEVLQ
jgi:rare lipoprotein A